MISVFSLFLFVFIDSKTNENVPSEIRTMTEKSLSLEKLEEDLEDLREDGDKIIEISSNATEDVHPKRIRRLDSKEVNSTDLNPNSEKLVFLPSRTLKPPRLAKRLKKPEPLINVPINHKPFSQKQLSRRIAINDQPRPFNFQMNGPMPSSFKKPQSTSRSMSYQPINNIQDALNHYQPQPDLFPTPNIQRRPMSAKIQFAGKYRHPRKNGDLTRFFDPRDPKNTLQAVTPTTQIQPQPHYHGFNQNFIPDPFHNYKPHSPNDVNQLASNNNPQFMSRPQPAPYFRRGTMKNQKKDQKNPYKVASIPNYQMKHKETDQIYHHVVQANRNVDRNESQKNKPFSLMLDIYPMHGEQDVEQSVVIRRPVKKPTMSIPNLANFSPQMYYNDNSYFNSMNFPQLQQPLKYPMGNGYYRGPSRPQPDGEASNDVSKINKPSQLVVHLNLFPKKGRGKGQDVYKRSSQEEVIMTTTTTTTMKPTEVPVKKVEEQSNESAPSSPFLINFNLNNRNYDDNHQFMNSMDLNPRHQFRNLSHLQDIPTAPPTGNYFYDEVFDDDGSMNVSPSLIYNNIQRERPLHMALNSTVNHAHKEVVHFNRHDARQKVI